MTLFLSKLLPQFVYPPGICAVLLVLSLLLRKRAALARLLVATTLAIVFVTGTPYLPFYMVRALETWHLPPKELPAAQAIVVLGGGTKNAREPRRHPEVSEGGDRVIHAARLYREGKAPLVVASGGAVPFFDAEPEASDIVYFLEMLGVPGDAILSETRSRNTLENAMETEKLLRDRGVRRILLVTSAIHMPRAASVFEQAGFDVVPAPTDYTVTDNDWKLLFAPSLQTFLLGIVPSSSNVDLFNRALKEIIGMAVYRLRGDG